MLLRPFARTRNPHSTTLPQVLCGDVAPDSLVVLPPEELASDAKKEENRLIREKKLFDSAPSAAKQAREGR